MCKYWCNYKKEHVLATFANFAYNPRNLEDLRTLQVTELFLDMLTEENENVSSRSQTTNAALLQCMLFFSISHSPRLRNLASVFLKDCCTKEQVARAEVPMQGHYPTAQHYPTALPKDEASLET
ncbi:armadillo repeat-containing protein 7-like [Salvelinus namaycush]|uniref:Armadillo repeat-containing protein 7-like n=1 Tax=Salvelinus namaycush TaxID=8040 RepID=A0A8U0TX68_SALNM|nr:armadillo repeat-containing protein 7-like [Salvelinus namaycush]